LLSVLVVSAVSVATAAVVGGTDPVCVSVAAEMAAD
jgi:hypothetical protein